MPSHFPQNALTNKKFVKAFGHIHRKKKNYSSNFRFNTSMAFFLK